MYFSLCSCIIAYVTRLKKPVLTDRKDSRRNKMNKKPAPSIDQWMKEAKADPNASKIGMYLVHNGTVRETAKAKVRFGEDHAANVTGREFYYDAQTVSAAIEEAKHYEGIYFVRVWLNEGTLSLGDDIMYVLIGGDIRPHVIDALQALVGIIKNECVFEKELH